MAESGYSAFGQIEAIVDYSADNARALYRNLKVTFIP